MRTRRVLKPVGFSFLRDALIGPVDAGLHVRFVRRRGKIEDQFYSIVGITSCDRDRPGEPVNVERVPVPGAGVSPGPDGGPDGHAR